MGLIDAARRVIRGDQDIDQDRLRDMADFGTERLARYERYEEAYDGRLKPPLLDRAKLWLDGTEVPFSENFCDVPVDVLAERLRVEAVRVTDQDPMTEWLKRMWARDRFDALQQTVHQRTPELGDGFVVADWHMKDGRSTFKWNHPRNCKPIYAEDNEELLGFVKKWRAGKGDDARWRMNIYWPDNIEKWVSSDREGEFWVRYEDPTDYLTDDEGDLVLDDDQQPQIEWPTPWVDGDEEPLEIPWFHFRHRAAGREFGRSDVHKAIPFQRELHKQLVDLFYVGDQQGWPQRWASGVSGQESIRTAIGEWIKLTDPQARAGQLAGADIGPLAENLMTTLTRLSIATGTPMHDLIKGTPPTGEALKTSESRLTKRGLNAHIDYNGPWVGATRYGWRLASVFGEGDEESPPADYDPDAVVELDWESVETRNEETEAQTLEAHQRMGVSRQTLLRKLGYDPEEEAKQRKVETEAAAEEKKADAEALAAAFNAGETDDE